MGSPMSRESLVDIELERAFIGHVLRRPSDLRHVSKTPSAGDFATGEHRSIWSVVLDLDADEIPAGFEVVSAELRRRAAPKAAAACDRMAESAHAQDPRMVSALCDRIGELAEHRRVVERLHRALVSAQSAGSAAEARTLAEASIVDHDDATGFTTMGEEARKCVDEARSGDDSALASTTGIQSLDATLGGGLKRGHMTIVCARPGMGKSAFASSIGSECVFRGGSAAVFSLEMTKRDWVRRTVQSLSKATAHELGLTNGDHTQACVDAAVAGLEDAGSRFVIEDQAGMTVEDIASLCRNQKRRHGLDVVVVDYAQLAKTGKRTASREREVAEISQGLLAIAKSLDCSMIAVTQLNRSLESRNNRRPLLSDLRDSGQLEQDAHEVIALYRHSRYEPMKTVALRNVVELHVIKSRSTAPTDPTSPLLATFRGETMGWRETPGEQSSAYMMEVLS